MKITTVDGKSKIVAMLHKLNNEVIMQDLMKKAGKGKLEAVQVNDLIYTIEFFAVHSPIHFERDAGISCVGPHCPRS